MSRLRIRNGSGTAKLRKTISPRRNIYREMRKKGVQPGVKRNILAGKHIKAFDEATLSGYLRMRLDKLSHLLVTFRSAELVIRWAMKEWNVNHKRAKYYIKLVYAIWARDFKGTVVDHAVRAVADREGVIKQAIAEHQYGSAIRAMDSRDKILGVLRESVRIDGSIEHSVADLIAASQNGGFKRGNRIAELMGADRPPNN